MYPTKHTAAPANSCVWLLDAGNGMVVGHYFIQALTFLVEGFAYMKHSFIILPTSISHSQSFFPYPFQTYSTSVAFMTCLLNNKYNPTTWKRKEVTH
ncbi:hypothetical protein CC78DRAFT_531081 [Lojkania enalia]|uniref:Uncharacterized protein n=1 Tax=Lojkania enalia TaxID=147567 RepID=A0A9P4KE86_9PLEO|nr:hypothetical protein CC78DRAFT_531081 [Didymosphaeria enalia]